jgi:Photosynthesis system II assembly factor YCF48
MALDDRERNFEDALARNLQANLLANASAGTPAPTAAPHDNCPDAEILAAYHERLLDTDEMILRKEHIASCLPCQEVLAQLEATEEIPLALDGEAIAPTSAVAVPHTQFVHAARASASPAAQAAARATAAQPNFPVETLRRFATWRWLVPAGALAAGLLIWFAIKGTAPQTGFQLAKNQAQTAPRSAPISPPPSTNSIKDKSAESDLQAPTAAKTDTLAKSAATSLDEKGAREQKAPPPSPSSPLKTPRDDGQPGGFVISPKQAQTQSRVLRQSPSENNELARDAAPSPASPAPATSNSVANAGTLTRSAPRDFKKEWAVSGTGGAPATEEAQANRGGVLPLRKAADLPSSRNPQLVSSPEGEVMWRLLPSGIVQRSADAGATWTLQKTGVVVDLLAGSAPSDQICWVVGRGGTILRTADGGNHWLKVSAPTADDITTVFGVDAQQATITTAKNNSYKTTNGGTSWTAVPNP